MKLNILFLCDKPKSQNNANTILDHIGAFENYSCHTIWTYSNLGDFSSELQLNKFDVVIVHYSVSILYEYFISPSSKKQLREFSGLKVLFIQDEYRRVNQAIKEIEYINFDVLFSCFPSAELERIYPTEKLPNLSKYTNLTGYVPEKLLNLPNLKKINERPIDVGYRGRKIPFWLGELAYEKWTIVEHWYRYTKHTDLLIDISYNESDRIYGENWIDFISSCKTMLGVESGASVIDFTSKLETIIDFHQRTYPDDDFYYIQNMYLKEYEGLYKLNQISPRCFEAIALKTVLVLYEGEYSGILVPNRHYIPLKKDFSNIQQVLDKIKDTVYLQNMANIAYEEVAANPKYHYQAFMKNVDEIIETEFKIRAKCQVKFPYCITEFKNDIKEFENLTLSNQFDLNIPVVLIDETLTTPKELDQNCPKELSELKLIQSRKRSSIIFLYFIEVVRNSSSFKFLKTVVTRKIKLFNPVLRRIKYKLINLT